jgi:hypothetical protein
VALEMIYVRLPSPLQLPEDDVYAAGAEQRTAIFMRLYDLAASRTSPARAAVTLRTEFDCLGAGFDINYWKPLFDALR